MKRSLGIVALPLLAIFVVAAHPPDWLVAHRQIEAGIDLLGQGAFDEARGRLELALELDVRPHVVLEDLADLERMRGDYAAAHELYEEALERRWTLASAHFNDGHALFTWGTTEVDPSGCRLERATALWRQALVRFEDAERYAWPWSALRRAARADAAELRRRLAELETLAEQCPPTGGGGGGQGGSAGGEDPPGQPPPGGEGRGADGPSGTPPPAAGLSEQERQQIQQALERIQQQAAEGGLRQVRQQQLGPDADGGVAGDAIWW